eukprot:6196489-Pleurochrysis_carterae.AAC.2
MDFDEIKNSKTVFIDHDEIRTPPPSTIGCGKGRQRRSAGARRRRSRARRHLEFLHLLKCNNSRRINNASQDTVDLGCLGSHLTDCFKSRTGYCISRILTPLYARYKCNLDDDLNDPLHIISFCATATLRIVDFNIRAMG